MAHTNVSRRNFLKGATFSAMGVGIAGLGLNATSAGVAFAAEGEKVDEVGAASSQDLLYTAYVNPQDYDYRQNSGDVSALFSDWQLGPLSLSCRMVKSAAGSATYLAGYTDELYQYYLNLARGGVEMIWVEGEAFAMPTDGSEVPQEAIDFFTSLTAECADYGSKLGFQWAPFGINPVDLDLETIQAIQAGGAALAATLQSMGFVGIEINSAGFNQGHLFLSRFHNAREDEYGPQSIENRARFDVECIQQIKEACGEDFIVQVLMEPMEENDNLTNDCNLMTMDCDVTAPHNLATTMAEGIALAKEMEAAGADSFHLRLGPLGNHPCQFGNDLYFILNGIEGATGYGTQWDFGKHWEGRLLAEHSGVGMLIDVAAAFKEQLSVPVGCVTYMDPAHAVDHFNAAIAEGKIDFMMMTRPLTVDFDYVHKLREGRIDEIAPCTRCLHCHIGSNEMNAEMGYCRVNACTQRVMREGGPVTYELPTTETPKNVMVVGAGPAGLEAARVAALRGHAVTLVEKKNSLGGSIPFAEMVKGPHENLSDLVAYLGKQCELAGVTIQTETEATVETIAEAAPDALVVAVGGVRPEVPVVGANVVDLENFLMSDLGENVVVYGSGAQAFDTALWLTVHKKRVTILSPEPNNELDMQQSHHAQRFMTTALYSLGVKVWSEVELLEAGEGTLTYHSNATGVDNTIAYDSLINAAVMVPNTELAENAGIAEVYCIGDAAAPFNIAKAIHSGNDVGRLL